MFPFRAPMGTMEEIGKQNMAMLQNAMKIWAPFGFEAGRPTGAPQAASPASEPGAGVQGTESLDELRKQLEAMQARLSELSKKG
jgi:polyhydroxyalkanoate synthesis regulator protein